MNTSKAKISAAERQAQALELRKQGESIRSIAQALGVSVSTVHGDIQKALGELRERQCFSTEEWVTLELERLDVATLAIAEQVKSGNLKAIDRWLRIIERRSKLLGLDKAPQQSIDILSALKILIENGILPPQIVGLAGEELTRATTAITKSITQLEVAA